MPLFCQSSHNEVRSLGPLKRKMAGNAVSLCVFLQHACICILLISITLLQISLALYEDEVGLFDWRQQHVGKVKFAYFDQYSHNSRRAWVSTQSNVIAALNARTGSIIWRKVFEGKNGRVDSLLHHANALISVSGYGRLIRSWEPNKGYLQWEVVSETKEPTAGKEFGVKGLPGWGAALIGRKNTHSNAGVAMLFGNAVRVYGVKDGSEWWTWKPEFGSSGSPSESSCLALHAVNDKVYILLKKSQILMELIALDADSGSVESRNTLPAEWLSEQSSECIVVGHTYLACLEVKSLRILLLNMLAPGDRFTEIPLQPWVNEGESSELGLLSLGPQYDGDEFILKVKEKEQNLLRISKDGKGVETLDAFPNEALLLATTGATHTVLVSLTSKLDTLNIKVFDLIAFKELESLSQSAKFDGAHGHPDFGAIYLFSKKDNELGYRLLVAFEDHALCLVHQSGQVLWKREEALAGITSVEMIELPAATSASKLELLHEEFAAIPNGLISDILRTVKYYIMLHYIIYYITSIIYTIL